MSHLDARNIKVLCGRDLTEGREGGTWLGADDRGRVAMLTNVFTGTSPKPGAAGRGFLVIDYLQVGLYFLKHAVLKNFEVFRCANIWRDI